MGKTKVTEFSMCGGEKCNQISYLFISTFCVIRFFKPVFHMTQRLPKFTELTYLLNLLRAEASFFVIKFSDMYLKIFLKNTAERCPRQR